jgi:hypothetical protein
MGQPPLSQRDDSMLRREGNRVPEAFAGGEGTRMDCRAIADALGVGRCEQVGGDSAA